MKLLPRSALALIWAASLVVAQSPPVRDQPLVQDQQTNLTQSRQKLNYQQNNLTLFTQPRNITVQPQIDAEMERLRLRQAFRWADVQPTGFFLNPNSSLKLSVSGLPEGQTIRLVFGPPAIANPAAPDADWGSRAGFFTYTGPLHNGDNDVSDLQGGIIYIHYTYQAEPAPPAVTVSLGEAAQPFPWYDGKTGDVKAFVEALSATKVPFAELNGNRVIVTGLAETARRFINASTDINAILDTYAQIISAQDKISGLSSEEGKGHDRPSPLRPMVVEANSTHYGSASHFRAAIGTSHPEDIWRVDALKKSWKMWHELGHQRQHTATWSWENQTEVTVNIYSLAARRHFLTTPNSDLEHATHEEWLKAKDWLAQSQQEKDFEEGVTDAGRLIQLVMFEQLRLAFGDAFYWRLHHASRKMDASNLTQSDIKENFMRMASQQSDTDLTSFFTKWGLRPSEQVIKTMREGKRPKRDYTTLETFVEKPNEPSSGNRDPDDPENDPENDPSFLVGHGDRLKPKFDPTPWQDARKPATQKDPAGESRRVLGAKTVLDRVPGLHANIRSFCNQSLSVDDNPTKCYVREMKAVADECAKVYSELGGLQACAGWLADCVRQDDERLAAHDKPNSNKEEADDSEDNSGHVPERFEMKGPPVMKCAKMKFQEAVNESD